MAKGVKSEAAKRREARGLVKTVDPVVSAKAQMAVRSRYRKTAPTGVAAAIREQANKRAYLEARLLRDFLRDRDVMSLGVTETAMQLMPEVMQTVVRIMVDSGVDPRARINAAKTIAEWSCVFGPLPEHLTPRTRDVDELPPADLDSMIADLKALRDRKAAAERAVLDAVPAALDALAGDVRVIDAGNPLTE